MAPTILALIVIALVAVEIAFRWRHQAARRRPYHVALRFKWNRMHVVPHPYLSFAYKKNETIDLNQPLPYELHPNRYFSFKNPLKLNRYGYFGPDWPLEKPPGTLRIACLGASATANNIADADRDYSYPDMLQRMLAADFREAGIDQEVEVLNFGIGGRTTAELVIVFFLHIVHFKPDVVLFYQGFNDLMFHLMDDFAPDYSHGRCSLGERIHAIRFAHALPRLPWWHSYEALKERLFGTGNTRNDLWRVLMTQKPDMNRDFEHMEVKERFLESIVAGCRHYGFRLILGTYGYYEYRFNKTTLKYRDGVMIENDIVRAIGRKYGLTVVDLAETIPNDADHYVDSLHLSPKGMEVLARGFADAILTGVAGHPGSAEGDINAARADTSMPR